MKRPEDPGAFEQAIAYATRFRKPVVKKVHSLALLDQAMCEKILSDLEYEYEPLRSVIEELQFILSDIQNSEDPIKLAKLNDMVYKIFDHFANNQFFFHQYIKLMDEFEGRILTSSELLEPWREKIQIKYSELITL